MAKQKKPNKDWLKNAAVQSRIEKSKSGWEVSLVFIDCNNPNQVLIRKINTYRTEKLAQIAANYMEQTAAKDPKGTKKIDPNAYHFNDN